MEYYKIRKKNLMLTSFSFISIIYIIAAVLPAIVLLIYVYSQDHVDPEPTPLIIKLLIAGAVSAVIAVVLEQVGEGILKHFVPENTYLYIYIFTFLIVGVVEEGVKFIFLKIGTWANPHLNYKFDGIVYSVAVSLGFAGLENVGYIFRYGLLIAGQRAVLAVPAHVGFAVFMGIFYSRSKMYHNRGRRITGRLNGFFAWFFPAMLHGFYDTTAMLQSTTSTIVYISFVIVMYITVFTLVRNEGKRDMHL